MKDGPEGDEIISTLEPVKVGVDEDGDDIVSLVVAPVGDGELEERPASPFKEKEKPKKLTNSGAVALDALRKAVAAAPQTHPGLHDIPRDATLTTVSLWRKYCYQMGISTSQEERAKQQAFKRGSEDLVGKGYAAI
jgi:hypothetical protein